MWEKAKEMIAYILFFLFVALYWAWIIQNAFLTEVQ